MKGIICYYSNTGNTELACQYIKKKSCNIDFELFDITKEKEIELNKFDIIGLATFTDFGGVSKYFINFLNHIEKINNIPTFLFNTYGFMPGRTLKHFENLAGKNGFKIINGFSLHTPENYPPNRVKKMKFDNYPKSKHINKFNSFIKKINNVADKLKKNQEYENVKIKTGILNSLFPIKKRNKAKTIMGKQFVDYELCDECGKCFEVCAYNAVKLSPKPEFNHEKCYGCWACYNHCPEKAIHTSKYKGKGQYRGPNKKIINKLQ